MLKSVLLGDVTDNSVKGDIIIAMNDQLLEASALGRPFVKNIVPKDLLGLGSILTFEFAPGRLLHMVICHGIGYEGCWDCAGRYLRFGLDQLWFRYANVPREFSIVQIGCGEVGRRDGANVEEINKAINDSFLPVTMFIRNGNDPVIKPDPAPLLFQSGWSSGKGELAVVA